MGIKFTQYCLDRITAGTKGTVVEDRTIPEVEARLSLICKDRLKDSTKSIELVSIDNTIEDWNIYAGVSRIEGREANLVSYYETRREGELPYLTRKLVGVEKPKAYCVNFVLYSKEQLAKEGIAHNACWGIVSVNGLMVDLPQEPPTPATILRNSMGVEFGGNGQAIDRELFQKAVNYWQFHAVIE